MVWWCFNAKAGVHVSTVNDGPRGILIGISLACLLPCLGHAFSDERAIRSTDKIGVALVDCYGRDNFFSDSKRGGPWTRCGGGVGQDLGEGLDLRERLERARAVERESAREREAALRCEERFPPTCDGNDRT